jgi:hypothetical protein
MFVFNFGVCKRTGMYSHFPDLNLSYERKGKPRLSSHELLGNLRSMLVSLAPTEILNATVVQASQ